MNLRSFQKWAFLTFVMLSFILFPSVANAQTTQSESIPDDGVELVVNPVLREKRLGVCLRPMTTYRETGWRNTTWIGSWVGPFTGQLQANVKSWRRAEEDCTSGYSLNKTRLYNEVCARAVTSVGPIAYHQSLGCHTTWQYI
jgi:hypothetical protein